MTEEDIKPRTAVDDAILQQQYRRALSSFEGIILSEIELTNRLSTRLNYGIQAGTFILAAISISLSLLLFTLTSQVSRISSVVEGMKEHFISVSQQMNAISGHMNAIESRVALLETVDQRTALMDVEMSNILTDMNDMRANVTGIDDYLATVRNHISNVSFNMDLMNNEVQIMSIELGRMAKPMRNMNKMFPFP
ncbi:MAG: translation initiation factor 2 [Chromatiaceae bacterium]